MNCLLGPDDILVPIRKRELEGLIAQRDWLTLKLAEKDAQVQGLFDINSGLKNQITELNRRIEILETENKKIVEDCKRRDERISKLETIIDRREALLHLKECNSLADKAFQTEYRTVFNKDEWDPAVPHLGSFMNREPTDSKDPRYKFWNDFIAKYPGTNDPFIKTIYHRINYERNDGEHPSINGMSEKDFDRYMNDAFPSAYTQNQCIKYRDWSFLFPDE